MPVFYADHAQHATSAGAFLAASKDDFCALRSIGEVYATLTGLPVRPRITGPEGVRIVSQISERLTLVTLSEAEYNAAIETAARNGIVGAALYDALIAECALKANASMLLTWNVRDFMRLGTAIASIVKTPLDLNLERA